MLQKVSENEMTGLVLKTTLPAPTETLWQEWTDHTKITKWFSPEANIEPRQGGAYELFFDTSNHDSMSTKGCKITEIRLCSLLAFQWKGPDQYAHFMNNPPQTHVEVALTPKDQETELTIKHTGWKQGPEWLEAKEWHDKAWQGVLKDLKKHLA